MISKQITDEILQLTDEKITHTRLMLSETKWKMASKRFDVLIKALAMEDDTVLSLNAWANALCKIDNIDGPEAQAMIDFGNIIKRVLDDHI